MIYTAAYYEYEYCYLKYAITNTAKYKKTINLHTK